MDLIARINQALDERRIEPGEFERAACILLQPAYPGLSAVEGGHDFGRDGDIYFPYPGAGPEARGRLMVTTGDPVANMRRGLQRLVAEQQRVDLVVMACSGPVDAKTRKSLIRLCEERGIPDPHVYARTWLTGALARDPVWRVRLTGVHGRLGSLLDGPLATSAQEELGSPELVGRDTERVLAQQFVDTGEDFVVTGQPGVGKTRLVQDLGRAVKFLADADPGQVVDDLISSRPSAVVVDDAHVRLAELDVLRRARLQEGLSFSIVATTWPDRFQEVVVHLPGASELSVAPLRRADMAALLQAVGVSAHRARWSILVQAGGRPGWALALCDLLLKGDGFQVATGSALVANVERFLLAATRSDTSVDVLACVAAIGYASAEDVQQLAQLVGIAPADISGLLYRLAHNGLLNQSAGRWSLQPTLRGPLIARWFFANPARRALSTMHSAFPERQSQLEDGVLLAAHTGSEPARREADNWLVATITHGALTTSFFDKLETYSALDEEAGRVAAQAASAVKRVNPSLKAPYPVVRAVVQHWALPEAISVLLDAAIGDDRPRPQTPDHPLRILADTAAYLDPDGHQDLAVRERILDTALDWLARERTTERWLVAAEVIASALSPRLEGTWPSLETVDAIAFGRGVPGAATLRQLVDLWSRVPEQLGIDAADRLSDVPPEAIRLLLGLAEEWVWLARGFATGDFELRLEQIAAGLDGARAIVESLRTACELHPGLSSKANSFLVGADPVVAPLFAVDPDLEAFTGLSRPPSREPQALQRYLEERAVAASELAEKLAELGPVEGVARFAELNEQARLADHQYGEATVARLMAPHLAEPAEWYLAARDADQTMLMQNALDESLSKASAGLPPEVVHEELHSADRRSVVIRSAVSSTTLNDTVELVLNALRAEDAPTLTYALFRNEVDEVLHRLLTHPVPEIASATALQLDPGEGQWLTPPTAWRTAWDEAFLNARADSGESESQIDSILKYLVAHEPDLAEKWFQARLTDPSSAPYPQPLRPRNSGAHLAALPGPHRARLARQYLAIDRPKVGRGLLTHLLKGDALLAETLLDEGVLSIDQVITAIGGGEDAVDELGPLLLSRGVAPELIATVACPDEGGWGDSIDAANRNLDYFKSLALRVPALAHVAASGVAEQERRLRVAEEEQKQARLRGEHS